MPPVGLGYETFRSSGVEAETITRRGKPLSRDEPARLRLALRGTDREDSDIDLLVDVPSGTTLFQLGRLQMELEALIVVRVDLLTPGDLPPEMRARVLAEARLV